MALESCIVEEWLRSIGLVHYTQAFLDNGYDDLEICKQIGDPDLDAIGVDNPVERSDILAAVKQLLEEGGTRVYFTLDPDYQNQSPISPVGAQGGVVIGGQPAPCVEGASNGCSTLPLNHIGGGGFHTLPTNFPSNYSNADGSLADYDEAGEYEVSQCCGQDNKQRANLINRSNSGLRNTSDNRPDAYEVGRAALVTFPRIQLAAIIRDRSEEDGLDLADFHLPRQKIEVGGKLDELTKKYSIELKTHYHHVLDAIRFLAEMAATSDLDNQSTNAEGDDSSHGLMFSVAGPSHRSVPPPLPSCPPPSASFADGSIFEGSRGSPHHMHRSPVHMDSNSHANEAELTELVEGEATLKKKSGIGRFFKSMSVRRSGRKYIYKQHEGDLHASQITMPDEERIELMLLVKEGKLSMHDAVETVKQYEDWKRRQMAQDDVMDCVNQSPTIDAPPPPLPPPPAPPCIKNPLHRRDSNVSLGSDCPKNKKVTFSLPLLKLPGLRSKGLTSKHRSLSTSDSPRKGRHFAQSSSDYCEPPVEISPDEEAFPGFPALKVDMKVRKKRTDISDPSHVASYSPSQWISPMLLRRYIKTDSKSENSPPNSREQRRGLFSSPFIKRKGSLDSKVPARVPVSSLRTSGSFGASEADRVKGHRGILHSSSLAFGSGDSIRDQSKGRSNFSTFSDPVVTETITVATVHATDCPDDDTNDSKNNDNVNNSSVRKITANGSPNRSTNKTSCSPGGQCVIENNQNVHRNNALSGNNCSLRNKSTAHPDCDSSPRIETCVVCRKNEENTKSDLSGERGGSARDSPDIGIEDTSPTGTLDSTASEDFKDSKYGSSSTMSVGSDVSPVTERRTGRKAVGKVAKITRNNTNSAGEECLSSDYEDPDDQSMKSTNTRDSIILKETCSCKHSLTPGSSPRHLPSSPSTMSEASHDADSIVYSPRRQKAGRKTSKRPRPKTVDELLARLGIQHLQNVFLVNGYDSLELFSEIEEEDLDELCIKNPEERAKILTAAHLLLDYEDSSKEATSFPADITSIASSQSQSGLSSGDSQHDTLGVGSLPPTSKTSIRGESESSSDELNLQHATISDPESSGDGTDDGTLRAVAEQPGDKNRNNNSAQNIRVSNSQNNVTSMHSKTSLIKPNGVTGDKQDSGILPSQDVLKVKYRTSTGTCTSPNLSRRSLTEGSDGDNGKKSQSSDSAVSSDMDSSSSSPLRRKFENGDESQARNRQQQRASTGSGQLTKPPKPKVPVRTVSLPATNTANGSNGSTVTSFKTPVVTPALDVSSGKQPSTDANKQSAVPTVRLGKISSVRDKV